MINNDIRLFIDADESTQSNHERLASERIERHLQINRDAFERVVPGCFDRYAKAPLTRYTLFETAQNKPNVLDVPNAAAVYHVDPEQQVRANLSVDREHFWDEGQGDCTLVVLGIGLGWHLLPLLQRHQPNNVILYEPSADFFKCSLLAIDWSEFLQQIAEQGVRLFIQIGEQCTQLFEHLRELNQSFAFSQLIVHRHFNHPLFLSASRKLTQCNQLADLYAHSALEPLQDVPALPLYSKVCSRVTPLTIEHPRVSASVDGLTQYYPELAADMTCYQPHHFMPVEDSNGAVNAYFVEFAIHIFAEDAADLDRAHVELFTHYPQRDVPVLHYDGLKFVHYQHYQLAAQVSQELKQFNTKPQPLAEQVPSLIMFGLGLGYQLAHLVQHFETEHLFVCEPNTDFFYVSLFAIDYRAVLTQLDERGHRLYLNIGDNGENLATDLLQQMNQIGAYLLADSYLYRAYLDSQLNQIIAQVREQLQVIFSISENLDHVYHGVEHLLVGAERGVKLLTQEGLSKLTKEHLETPVFIVGNGPSLDSVIEEITLIRDQVILVSCGTALKALHANGLTPDFQTEIEQCRDTHDWALRVEDRAYLKQICLLSVNGIHPDTAQLYKDTLIAVKDGETSSTVLCQLLSDKSLPKLQFSYPTVSNFAIDLFSALGFQQLYLCGIDLGFLDPSHHHSKFSGYYDKQGKAAFDYTSIHNTGLRVAGNFLPYVYTKYEFKLSRMTIERALQQGKRDVYNTSNGAKISGTLPLPLEQVLIVNSARQQRATLDSLMSAFTSMREYDLRARFNARFDREQTIIDFATAQQQLINLRQQLIEPLSQADVCSLPSSVDLLRTMIQDMRTMLLDSHRHQASYAMLMLSGTFNYFATGLTKLAQSIVQQPSHMAWQAAGRICHAFERVLTTQIDRLQHYHHGMDMTSSFPAVRMAYLTREVERSSVLHWWCDDSLVDTLTAAYRSLNLHQQWQSYGDAVLPEPTAMAKPLLLLIRQPDALTLVVSKIIPTEAQSGQLLVLCVDRALAGHAAISQLVTHHHCKVLFACLHEVRLDNAFQAGTLRIIAHEFMQQLHYLVRILQLGAFSHAQYFALKIAVDGDIEQTYRQQLQDYAEQLPAHRGCVVTGHYVALFDDQALAQHDAHTEVAGYLPLWINRPLVADDLLAGIHTASTKIRR